MQGNVKKHIRNAALFANSPPSPMPGADGISKYTGKQHEYFENPTSAYVFNIAKYASNYFKATIQGYIPGEFTDVRGAYIRSSDIVEQTTGAKMPNDYQIIYFQDMRIKGMYTGGKIMYGGNTWLAISPFNVADPMMQAVIRRCNAVWKHLDYYGNVLAEPFIFHDGRASATANEYLDWSVIPNWYQKCVMQLNERTKELAYNRRIVLGSSVVEVRGLVDFITDFSNETPEGNEHPEPAHVMFFDVQFQQPLEIDDMENGIAGGKAFSWVIQPSPIPEMNVGATRKIHAESIRNGESPDTDKYPVSYMYASQDQSVATVDNDGNVTAVGVGSTQITIMLEQNQKITATVDITVSEQTEETQIIFVPDIPSTMKQMQTYDGKVYLFDGDEEIGTEIQMTAYGDTEAAEAVFSEESKELTISCYEPSGVPLSLVFTAPEYNIKITKNIKLEGY